MGGDVIGVAAWRRLVSLAEVDFFFDFDFAFPRQSAAFLWLHTVEGHYYAMR